MDRYRFVSREENPGRDYHVDKYEILDTENKPVKVNGNPLVIERQVPKRKGKTKRERGIR